MYLRLSSFTYSCVREMYLTRLFHVAVNVCDVCMVIDFMLNIHMQLPTEFLHPAINSVIHWSLAAAKIPSGLETAGLLWLRPDDITTVPWILSLMVWVHCVGHMRETHPLMLLYLHFFSKFEPVTVTMVQRTTVKDGTEII